MKRISILLLVFAFLMSCDKKPDYITPVSPPEPPAPVIDEPEQPSEKAEYDFSVVEMPLEASMVFTSGYMLRYYSVMQSFALCGDGYMYGIQVGTSQNKYLLNVTYKQVQSDSGKQYMQLPFAGHGGNMDLERESDADYIWVGSYGTWNGTKYTNSQTVARIRFKAGARYTPSQCSDQYYLPGFRNVSPALDLANDRLLIWGLSNSESSTGYFKVFSLSEAKASPIVDMTLERSITYGGGDSGIEERTEKPSIKAHNLGTLTPLASIRLNGEALGTGANQGFALFGDYILHLNGGGNDSNPQLPSQSTLTVLNWSGDILGSYNVGAVSDKGPLASLGITDTGFMEAEGVKIYNDCLYLGYATKHSADTKRIVTIFKYNIKKK